MDIEIWKQSPLKKLFFKTQIKFFELSSMQNSKFGTLK